VQVADRWHLWHNLGEAVERAVTRHHACLREPVAEDEQATVATLVVVAPVRESRLVFRTQQRYAAVQERLAAGCSISQISRELDLERGTVCRFARAGSLDELLVKTTTRETQIDGFEPYLQRRWNEGCMNATRLYDEVRAQGFSGGVQIVRRYLRQFRAIIPNPRRIRPADAAQGPAGHHLDHAGADQPGSRRAGVSPAGLGSLPGVERPGRPRPSVRQDDARPAR